MQAIQESEKLLKEVGLFYPKMNEDDRVYYKMEMAKVHAMHGLAYALLAMADALKEGSLRKEPSDA